MQSDERTIDQSSINTENSNVVANEVNKTNQWKQVAVGGVAGIMLGAAGTLGFQATAAKADNQGNVANRGDVADNQNQANANQADANQADSNQADSNQVEANQANNSDSTSNASEDGSQHPVANVDASNQSAFNENNTQQFNAEAQVSHDDVLASTETAVHLDVPVAEVDQNMSFAVAFTSAREQVGPGGVFEWHDGVYSTYTPGEWDAMSSEAKNEYYDRVNITGNSTQSTAVPETEQPAHEPVEVNVNYYEVNETVKIDGTEVSEERTSQEEHANNTGDIQNHEQPTEINVNYYEVNKTIEVNDSQLSEEQNIQEERENNVQEETSQDEGSNVSGHDDNHLLNVAEVNDRMSFADAFAEARSQVGAGGMFEWHGKYYGTYTRSEWNSMSQAEKHAYNENVIATKHELDSSAGYDNNIADNQNIHHPDDDNQISNMHHGLLDVAEVDDRMSYADAFAEARSQVGAGGIFEWHGKYYGTYTGSEWDSMSQADKRVYYENVAATKHELGSSAGYDNNIADNQNIHHPDDDNHISNMHHGLLDVAVVDDSMSYADAFAEARSQVGAGGVFEWHGKYYGTYTGSEWDSMSQADKRVYYENLAATKADQASFVGDGYDESNLGEDVAFEETTGEDPDNRVVSVEDVVNDDGTTSRVTYAVLDGRETIFKDGVAMVDAEDNDSNDDNYYEEGGDEDESQNDDYYEEGGDEDEDHDNYDDDDNDDNDSEDSDYDDDYSDVGDDYGSDYDDDVSDMATDDNLIDI